MDQSFLALANIPDEVIPLVAIVGGLMIATVAIISGTVRAMAKTRAREESRREIAAYVAEGSITPEDAQRILEAGIKRDKGSEGCC